MRAGGSAAGSACVRLLLKWGRTQRLPAAAPAALAGVLSEATVAERSRVGGLAIASAPPIALQLPPACLQLMAAPAAAPAAPGSQPEYFVTIDNGEFVVGCERFLVAGWNQWEVVEAAAGAPSLSGASLPANQTGPQVRSLALSRVL